MLLEDGQRILKSSPNKLQEFIFVIDREILTVVFLIPNLFLGLS